MVADMHMQITAAAMMAAPTEAISSMKMGRTAVDTTRGFLRYLQRPTYVYRQAIERDIRNLNLHQNGSGSESEPFNSSNSNGVFAFFYRPSEKLIQIKYRGDSVDEPTSITPVSRES